MSKTYVVISLDTILIEQIRKAQPDSGFNSIEEAVASLVGDGVTGDHACWTDSISWMPGEDTGEDGPADTYAIGYIPREIAAKLNPLIGSGFQTDTLNNCSGLAQLLGEIASAPREVETKDRYEYLIGLTIEYALQYESAVNSARGKP
ncbi:HIRAN domain-containing protein [Methylococcus capsulatus]|uniref:HIRAN domain-containing protein n=1 Tax=Methylococcus capsulatus TaxID=414 RepID=UPI001C53242C|nr:HIRAN domain-containing protein [Methylococcus capsulatus]QXP94375.1 HIRAN domain-containing protein [Methylococcus capsulatus]